MSDTIDFMASYKNHQKALAEANAINKATLFDALATTGITTVNATFDGEGDSGQVENIRVDDSAEVPPISIELHRETGPRRLHGKRRSAPEARRRGRDLFVYRRS
jgi:hypothetical protein